MTEADWREQLTPEQYRILREKGTERSFTGPYWNTFETGTYSCTACGSKLFKSDTKFDAGCGWPSFFLNQLHQTLSRSTATPRLACCVQRYVVQIVVAILDTFSLTVHRQQDFATA